MCVEQSGKILNQILTRGRLISLMMNLTVELPSGWRQGVICTRISDVRSDCQWLEEPTHWCLIRTDTCSYNAKQGTTSCVMYQCNSHVTCQTSVKQDPNSLILFLRRVFPFSCNWWMGRLKKNYYHCFPVVSSHKQLLLLLFEKPVLMSDGTLWEEWTGESDAVHTSLFSLTTDSSSSSSRLSSVASSCCCCCWAAYRDAISRKWAVGMGRKTIDSLAFVLRLTIKSSSSSPSSSVPLCPSLYSHQHYFHGSWFVFLKTHLWIHWPWDACRTTSFTQITLLTHIFDRTGCWWRAELFLVKLMCRNERDSIRCHDVKRMCGGILNEALVNPFITKEWEGRHREASGAFFAFLWYWIESLLSTPKSEGDELAEKRGNKRILSDMKRVYSTTCTQDSTVLSVDWPLIQGQRDAVLIRGEKDSFAQHIIRVKIKIWRRHNSVCGGNIRKWPEMWFQ